MTNADKDAAPQKATPDGAVQNTLLGVALMALAMLILPMADGAAKYLSGNHSPLYISWARYVLACLLIVPVAVAKYGRNIFPRNNLGAHTVRTVLLMAAMTSYFVAIKSVPLATASSAFFIGPIVATLVAVVVLGEKITVPKALALVMGFAGAMLILQPQLEIQNGVLLSLLSGVLFGVYLVATRQASRHSDPIKTLVFQCLVGGAILTPQAIYAWSVPAVEEFHLFALIALVSVTSHMMSIAALRYADASTLAPLVYLELLASTIIGYVVFSNFPGPFVWAGAAIIVCGGLLLLRRNA